MSNEQDRLTALLCRYAAGMQLKQREWRRLRNWVRKRGHHPDISLRPEYFRELAEAEREKEQAWEELVARYEGAIDDVIITSPEKPAILRHLIRHAAKYAAAVLVASLLVASYFIFRPSPRAKPVVVSSQRQTDIPPGGYKARLMVEGGAIVYLDSNKTSTIPMQGNNPVKLQGDSSLVYQPGLSPPTDTAMHINELSTPRGAVFWLTLSEGTRVKLNAKSAIRYPSSFSGDNRQVELLQGQAFFIVQPDARKPFNVRMPDGNVIDVIGTRFDVNTYGDEKRNITTLVEGSISVSAGDRRLALRPGQQALTGGTQKNVVRNAGTNTLQQATAWANGNFRFDTASLDAVMKQLERWYDVDIDYQAIRFRDPISVGPIPMKATLSQMLDILKGIFPFDYTIDGKAVILKQG